MRKNRLVSPVVKSVGGKRQLLDDLTPLGFNVMGVFQQSSFKLKEVVIKKQHNCQSTRKWIQKVKKTCFWHMNIYLYLRNEVDLCYVNIVDYH